MNASQPWAATGAAGYLGSYVVEYLLARETPVLAVDNLLTGQARYLDPYRSNRNFNLAEQDTRDAAALRGLFKRHRPAAVTHLAALHFIPACSANPALTVSLNVHGMQSVLSAARAARVERIWFASTGDVYVPDDMPHHESNSPTGPFNIYGVSKPMGDRAGGSRSEVRHPAEVRHSAIAIRPFLTQPTWELYALSFRLWQGEDYCEGAAIRDGGDGLPSGRDESVSIDSRVAPREGCGAGQPCVRCCDLRHSVG